MRALTATVGVSVCLLAEESPRCPTGRASWCWTQLDEHRHPLSQPMKLASALLWSRSTHTATTFVAVHWMTPDRYRYGRLACVYSAGLAQPGQDGPQVYTPTSRGTFSVHSGLVVPAGVPALCCIHIEEHRHP